MKVIFLDIDGVLNSVMYDAERGDESRDTRIDMTRVALLAEIVKRTGAEIVLSSTWRDDWDKDPTVAGDDGKYIDKCLASYGLSIMDKTPELDYSDDRKDEIIAWLVAREERIDSFVVLDDIGCGWGEISDRVVVTNPYGYGLEQRHVNTAIFILNK